jgi:hypothetical protein
LGYFWGDLQERIKYTSPFLATGSKRKELSRIVEKKQKRKTLTQRESETLEDHQKILECEKLKDAEQRWVNAEKGRAGVGKRVKLKQDVNGLRESVYQMNGGQMEDMRPED